MVTTVPLQFGIPGGPELLIILLIAVLLFGANKLPKLARSSGQAMGEFQKGREEIQDELEQMREDTTGQTSGSSTSTDEPETTATDAGTETESTTSTSTMAEPDDAEREKL